MFDALPGCGRRATRTPRRRPAAPLLAMLTLCIAMAGCATPPAPPRTTVVLLPDEDGNVGAVSVQSATGTQQLEQAYGVARTGGDRAGSSEPATLPPETLQATYRQLMQAQPSKPKVFVLYFVLGKAELTAESRAQLPAVLTTASERKPTEISVFGHADALGKDDHNVRLSAARAEVVARLLRASDPSIGKIDVRYFGSKAPVEQPGAKGAQPRNRRAEVMIL